MLWWALAFAMLWILTLMATFGTLAMARRAVEAAPMWQLDQTILFLAAAVLLVVVLFCLFGDIQ
jgi:amino acid transporter